MFPEAWLGGLTPILGVRYRMGSARDIPSVTRMYKPEEAGKKDIPEFFSCGAVRSGKRQVLQLPDRTANSDFTPTEMVNDTEPVLVINRSKIPVEELRIDQERAAGN